MRSRDVQNEMTDDFEPTAGLKIGPDGMQGVPERTDLPPEPPRLCLAGPCKHYHRMDIQLDAQQPGAEKRPDGVLVQHGRVFHVETHHYCYPDVGIETNLGAHPVLECSRWTPETRLHRIPIVGDALARREARRIRHDYDRKLGRFHRQREDEAAAYAIDSVTFLMQIRFEAVGAEKPPGGIFSRVTEVPGKTVAEIFGALLTNHHVDPATFNPPYAVLNGDPLENLDATIGELGLDENTMIDLLFTPKETTP